MRFKPYRYQQFAVDRILKLPAVGLFLGMGLGKTVCTLSAIRQLMYEEYSVRRVLVIAPKSVAESTWPAELEKWDELKDLRMARVLGDARHRARALASDADIYVINRENVVWLVEYYRSMHQDFPFDMCVVDESSSFKNNQSKRFRALRMVRPFFSRVVILTGTPSANGLMDLWAQIYLLDRGERLGRTITAYRHNYFRPDQMNGFVVYSYKALPGAEEEITDKIKDITFSMKPEDYLELPDLVSVQVTVEMDDKAKKLYKEFKREYVLELPEGDIVAGSAAALTNKLLQLANGFAYGEDGKTIEFHEAKMQALKDIVDTATRPVLVFYEFIRDRERILKAVKGSRQLKTDKDIRDWNDGKIPVLLAHPQSAGYGLNLQAGGNTIVWYGMPWSLELYQQANARLYRQGQTEKVVIHHLITKGTMDEAVMRALQSKKMDQDSLIEAVKAEIGEQEA